MERVPVAGAVDGAVHCVWVPAPTRTQTRGEQRRLRAADVARGDHAAVAVRRVEGVVVKGAAVTAAAGAEAETAVVEAGPVAHFSFVPCGVGCGRGVCCRCTTLVLNVVDKYVCKSRVVGVDE